MNDHKPSKFNSDLLEKIKSETPRKPIVFFGINIFLSLGILLMLGVSIYLLSLFIIDTERLGLLFFRTESLSVEFWASLVLEFVVASGVLIFISYMIYRRTDWLLVRHKFLLVLAMFGVVILSSVVLTSIPATAQYFAINTRIIEQLPNHQNRQQKILENLEKKSVFVGRVVEINTEEKSFKLKNAYSEKMIFVRTESQLPKEKAVVAVKYEVIEGKYYLVSSVLLR